MTTIPNPNDDVPPVGQPRANPGNGKAPQSKKQQLICMLSTKIGTEIATASRKLGWQPHTTRAALCGLKKDGHVISVEKGAGGKPSRYRIASPAEATEER